MDFKGIRIVSILLCFNSSKARLDTGAETILILQNGQDRTESCALVSVEPFATPFPASYGSWNRNDQL